MSAELFTGHPIERVLYLETLPVFDGLSPPVVGALAATATERVVSAGTVIPFDASDARLFVVVEGAIEERFSNGAVLETGTGGLAGLVSIVSGDRGRIRATAHSVVLTLDWERQLTVAENHFELFVNFLKYLADLATDSLVRLPPGAVPPRHEPSERDPRLAIGNLVERTLALRTSSDLPRGSLDALFELARHIRQVDYRAGDVIWQTGADAKHFLELTAGTVRCAHADGSFLVPFGRTMGMFDLLRGVNRWYDAVAHEPVVAMWIEGDVFFDILGDHLSSALELAASLGRRVVALRGAL